ncbi:MAG: 16S rRNA (uracil(1498)-N(3))-methyltransferase [Clostridia bacterium]|nr:16S rRNA (uracil(1498)-N(3))-methyltransferase [Clostridia bacterium]
MPRFFVDKSNVRGDTIFITGEDVGHIKKVLRLRPGENIIICDGNGTDYLSEIQSIEQDKVIAGINAVEKNLSEPPIDIVLFQGLPKSDKMDFIIQKSVELGVNSIVPVSTERTVVKIDTKKDADHKVVRWQRIALEAAKQCNRGIVPKIEAPVTFEQALNAIKNFDISLIPYEKENQNKLNNTLQKQNLKRIAVFIGPEGGFSEKEIQRSKESGTIPVTLGPRILRTETAGIMVLSILMYALGDVG